MQPTLSTSDSLGPGVVARARAARPIIYLAAPYTDADPAVRQRRYEMATTAAAALTKAGHVVFSPVTLTHPLDVLLAGDSTLGSEYWLDFDRSFMEVCSELYVLQLEGWKESAGVSREVRFFLERRRPVHYLDPGNLTCAL